MTSERKIVPDNGLAADLHTAPQIHREDSVQDAIIEEQYAHLVETVRDYNPAADFVHIESAYHFAKRCHEGQRRKSGEPYIIHPLAVAQIVAEELKLDSESIEAALLHDCIEDTAATYADIARLFSPTVADLVEGVSKLTRIQYATKEDEQMENLRKMLIAMSKDIRVILIKISDRLHNMRTMEYQSPAKQKQKSLETMEIYAPIAHRLGMQRIKWELEDLSLKYLDPVGFEEINSSLQLKAKEYDAFMKKTQDQIDKRLQEMHIPHTVYGRMKHPYSIYRKMFSQNKQLDEIFDLFAFRVIVGSVGDCYNVLGVIHDLYKPILGRFKDYIGTPKPNGYQSLHTTVMGSDGIPFEVQIRTEEMHEIAEYGVAAHWKYKQGGAGAGTEGKYEWVRRLLENQDGTDAEEYIHSLKVDMFSDEVFVFTPNGDVQNLPAGATPIDFAYAIHSAVGNHMIGAKINGRIVTLDTSLKNGDIVEIITSKSAKGPSRDWLKIAKSSEARSKIRQWFKKEKKDENIVGGPGGLRGGAEALRHRHEGGHGPGAFDQRPPPDLLRHPGGALRRHRLRRLHRPEGRQPHPGGAGPHRRQAPPGGEGRRALRGEARGPQARPAEGPQRAGHHCGGPGQLPREVLQVLHPRAGGRDRGLHHPGLRRQRPPLRLPQRQRGAAQAPGPGGPLDQGLLGQRHPGQLSHLSGAGLQGPE